MRILITGGSGFIGSHVVLHLIKKYQYKVVNLDKLDFVSSQKNLKEVENSPDYQFIKGDILDADLVQYILVNSNIDTILHFACQNHLDESIGNSIEFTKNNVLGTHVLLEAARIYGKISRFIHISTDEVYGGSGEEDSDYISKDGMNQAEEEEIGEGTVLEPPNPYAASKAAAEHLVKTYYKSFRAPTMITRSNSVFGPHQYPENVIPKFIGLLEREMPCYIHGDGKRTHRYLYIDDFVSALDLILHKGQEGEIYNIGTSFEICPLEIAKKLLKMFHLEDRRDELICHVPDRPFPEKRYAIDATKLNQLGWKPQVPFEEGLKKTSNHLRNSLSVEWYRTNFHNWEKAESVLVAHPTAP